MSNVIDLLIRVLKEGDGLQETADDLEAIEEKTEEVSDGINISAGVMTAALAALVAFIQFERQAIEAAAATQMVYSGVDATISSMGLNYQVTTDKIRLMADALQDASTFDSTDIAMASEAFLRIEDLDTSKLQELLKLTVDYAAGARKQVVPAAEAVARAIETGETRSLGFSKAIREQISEMVSAGDKAGALALIMEELNSKYGGQAVAQLDTYTGSIEHLKNTWEAVMEDWGTEWLPLMQAGVEVIDMNITLTRNQRMGLTYLNDAYEEGRITMDEYNAALDKMNISTQIAPRLVDASTQSYIDMAKFYEERLTPALEDTVEQFDAVSMAAVRAGVSGSLQGMWDKANEDIEQYNTNIAWLSNIAENGAVMIMQLRMELQEAETTYGKNSDEVAKLHEQLTQLEETYGIAAVSTEYWEGKLDELNATMDEATARFIYNQIAASMDAETALLAARALGILSEADYQAAAAIQTLTAMYDENKDGIVASYEAGDEYAAKLALIAEAINYLRTNNQPITQQYILDYIETHSVTTYTQSIALPSTMAPAPRPGSTQPIERAGGGPVEPGSYIWNEDQNTRPEFFVSGGGFVLTKQDAMAAIGGSGDVHVNLTYAPMVSLVDQAELQERLQPFIEAGIRQAQSRGS